MISAVTFAVSLSKGYSDFVWEGEPWPAGEYIVSEKDRKAIYLSDILVKEN